MGPSSEKIIQMKRILFAVTNTKKNRYLLNKQFVANSHSLAQFNAFCLKAKNISLASLRRILYVTAFSHNIKI